MKIFNPLLPRRCSSAGSLFERRFSFASGKREIKDEAKTEEFSIDSEGSPREKPVFSITELQAINAFLAKSKGVEAPKKQVDSAERKRRITIARVFRRLCNAQAFRLAKTIMSDDVLVQYLDNDKNLSTELSPQRWVEEMDKVCASFPDFSYSYDRISCSFGVVILHGWRSSGTHQGAPYSFGPCEPIKAVGKKVLSDPGDLYLFFREGEHVICRVVFCARGEIFGPGGIYTQLGGFPFM